MEIHQLSLTAYMGRNRFTAYPSVHFVFQVRLPASESARIGVAFEELLSRHVPSSALLLSSRQRLSDGLVRMDCRSLPEVMTWLANLVLEMQSTLMPMPLTQQAKVLCQGDRAELFLPYESALLIVGLTAWVMEAVPLMLLDRRDAAWQKTCARLDQKRDQCIHNAHRLLLDQTTAALVQRARERGIPAVRMSTRERLVCLGQGVHQRYIRETQTSQTVLPAIMMVSDKALCHQRLQQLGIPVPEQRVLSASGQVQAVVRDLGFPLVVKPSMGKKGQSVFVNIQDTASLLNAIQSVAASKLGQVLVERHIQGNEYRLFLVGGRLIAAARRVPAHVTGDGRLTVRALVDQANQDERRGHGFSKVMNYLVLDEETARVLKQQGMDERSVPDRGQQVFLRWTANISTGGQGQDVTDDVHPDVMAMAELAVTGLQLDVAGLDYISPDISRSWHEVGGAVIEVNHSPGLRPHWSADDGRRDVVGPVLEHLFPDGANGRIPTVAVTGSVGKTTTCRLLKNILMAQGHRVGLVCTDGMYVQNTLRRIGDFSGGTPCRDLLLQPDIDAAVMETARGGMLKWGLGFDRCDVAVMTAVTDTQTGMDGIPDEDAMADLKGYLLEAATDAVVLNADDHRVMLQRSRVPADCQVLLFSQNPDNPEILEHVRRGGTAVILRGRGEGACIRVCEAANEQTLVSVADVPLVSARGQRHNMGNVMAAAAAALGMAVPKADIVRGLTTLKDNPGRQMFIEGLPFRLVLDRAECRTRMQALCQVAQAQPVFGRRLLLMTMPGNRPDQHFDDVARVVAGQFDHFVLFSWMDLRGRSRDFMPARLMSALTEAGVDPSCIDTVSDQAEAYAHGLRMAAPGDLLCVVMLERGLARDAFLDLVNQGPDFPADHYRAFLRRAKQSLGGSKQVRTSGAVPVEEDAPL